MGFPAHGLLLGVVGFYVYQGEGAAAAGVFACLSIVVGMQAFFYVVCPASVEGAIAALEDVGYVFLGDGSVHACAFHMGASDLCKETARAASYMQSSAEG